MVWGSSLGFFFPRSSWRDQLEELEKVAEEALLVRSLDYGDDLMTCYHRWSVKHRQKNGVFFLGGGENATG